MLSWFSGFLGSTNEEDIDEDDDDDRNPFRTALYDVDDAEFENPFTVIVVAAAEPKWGNDDGDEFKNPFDVVLEGVIDDAFEDTHVLFNDVEVVFDTPNPLKMVGEFLGGVNVAGRRMGEFMLVSLCSS